MLKEPWFWRDKTIAARIMSAALLPAAAVYQFGARARRAFAHEEIAAASVICVGNINSGGVGKTPFAIALSQLLSHAGMKCAFATRGYGGKAAGPMEVDPSKHRANEVGDEAILLARIARTWIAKNRAAGVRAAAAAGGDIIIMDDGFQNPTIKKDVTFLLIDNEALFGNGKTLPAGPLREPIDGALERADAIVVVVKAPGEEIQQSLERQIKDRPVFRCWIEADNSITPQRAVAFAGIGNPERFFETAETSGFDLAGRFAFPDHHRFCAADIDQLKKQAAKNSAILLTTEKDFVRLPDDLRDDLKFLPVEMKIDDPDRLVGLINAKIKSR